MATSTPVTRVLSQALEEAIGQSRVRTAVFVTFQLDPAFLEQHVLPCLSNRAFSEQENVRRAQLDEELTGLDHVAVYYDREGLITEGGPARLDYARYGVSTPGGVLHAKHVLVLVEDPPEDADPDETADEAEGHRRLIVLTTSANLTSNGWRENVEVGQVHIIEAGTKDTLRDDLLGPGGLIARLKGLATSGMGHPALDDIRDFLRREVRPYQRQPARGTLLPRLWTGSETLTAFITEKLRLATERCHLEIVSPFFEDTAEARTLQGLLESLAPRSTRIYLPRDSEGRALCSEAYHQAVAALPNVAWGELPTAVLQYSRGGDKVRRYVHAKVYRLFSPKERWDFLIVGSPNLTSAAHRGARSGNLETAIFIDISTKRRPDWWMSQFEELIHEFVPQRAEDELDGPRRLPITLRFDWREMRLSYFLEEAASDPPPLVAIHGAGGGHLCDLSPPQVGKWRTLPQEVGDRAGEMLKAGAFMELRVPVAPSQMVLVHEEGMALKPSILESLSAQEILEYWALLTPEQRDAFLESRLAALLESSDLARAARLEGDDGPGMFDRFSGLFHAFSCLRERLERALSSATTRGEKEAVYRLFGRRHDTLRSLLEKLVSGEEETDPVNRYFGVLCCDEVVRWLRREHGEFARGFKKEMRVLDDLLQAGRRLRDDIDLGEGADREAFLEWLEKSFFAAVRLPGGERAA